MLHPKHERTRQLANAEDRGARYADRIKALIRQQAREIIPAAAVETARTGTRAEALALLRAPKAGPAERLLRECAAEAWEAGLLEAGRLLEGLEVPGLAAMARRHFRRRRKSDDYSEETPEQIRVRLRKLRARESQRVIAQQKRALPEVRYVPTREEERMLADEARRLAAGMKAIVRDLVTGEASDLPESRSAMRTNNRDRLASIMDLLREDTPGATALYEKLKLERRSSMASAMEVDWQTFQRGNVERLASERAIAGFQWINAEDIAVTCICELFGSQVIAADDSRVVYYAPRLHYNCRCAFFPRSIATKALITWDTIQTFTVRERDGSLTTLTCSPSQIAIPQRKPNQPPPDRCTDWLDRSRQPRVHDVSQHEQERRYLTQLRERKDRHLEAIMQGMK